MCWRIELFGGPLLVSPTGERVERFATQKAAGLLAYLALTLPRAHSREVLAELFWPEKDPLLSRNSLSAALSDLRPVARELLVTDKLRVGLDASRIITDIAEFEALLAQGDIAGARQLSEPELLPGFYEDWVIAARERLHARLESRAEVVGKSGGQAGRLHGLPLVESTFIGRGEERETVLRVLRSGGRLLTLRGMGGVGKTRLAYEAARQCRESFPGGIYWVSLDDVQTGDGLLRRVVGTLGLTPQPTLSLLEQLARGLAGQGRALLVLDNAEQIPDAAQALHSLLMSDPEYCCLVTSRRALGLRAEVTLELNPLPLSDAEQLFRERVAATQAGLTLPSETAPAVTQLCQRLDGLPLALELAAARITTLTPRQMLDRFDERFRLLQTKAVDLPERHRTLRAAIAWSYEALSAEEKCLLMQLSVFVGAFSLEDAEAVCAGGDTLEGMFALQDSSLLSSEPGATQAARFLLMESLRHYATERLTEQPELLQQSRQRHAAYFLGEAEKQLALLRTRDEVAALAALDALAPNLGAALENAPHALIPRIALTLARPLQRRGFFAEAVGPLERGLSIQRLPELLWERAGLHFDQGEYAPARSLASEAWALYQQQGDLLGSGRAKNLLGQIAYKEHLWSDARALLERALNTLAPTLEKLDIAIVKNNLALVEQEDPAGDRERATMLLTEALTVRRTHGDLRGVAAAVANLGNLAYAREDWSAARRHFTEALEVEAALGHVFGIARALNNLGETAERQGESEQALRLYFAACQLFSELKHEYAAYTEGLLQALVESEGIPPDDVTARRKSLVGMPMDALIREAMRR